MLHSLSDVESRLENNSYSNYPDIGFLVGRRGVALRVMRTKLLQSDAGAAFAKKVDEREFQETKTLLLAAYVEGNAEKRAKVEAAKTLVEIQKVFVEMMDTSKVDPEAE